MDDNTVSNMGAGPSASAELSSNGRPALQVTGVHLTYGRRVVLDGLDLVVEAGRSVSVMGPSGAGKSSLLSIVLGLVRPDSGAIVVNGQLVKAGNSSAMSRIRREEIGVIFQSGEMMPELSPVENVALAGLLAGATAAAATARAADLLTQLRVPDGDRSVTEFSGGEQQRVAVARALMNQPSVLLADEPTGSLDPATRDQVVELLFRVPEQFGCALVVVTHDPSVADRADRQLSLHAGRLVDRLVTAQE